MQNRSQPRWTATECLLQVLIADLPVSEADERANDILRTGDVDWSDFAQLCQFHRVERIVSGRISELNLAQVPAEFLGTLALRLKKQIYGAMLRVSNTVKIAEQFDKAGIQYVLMKSDAVGERYYERPIERASKDIDLLINSADYYRAFALLEELGFRQNSPHFVPDEKCFGMLEALRAYAEFEDGKGTSVELHWRLFRNPELLKDVGRNFEKTTETIRLAGRPVRVLSAPRQLVYLCCHGVHHSWFRLKWMADLHRVLNQLSQQELADALKIADENRVRGVVEDAMAICHALLEPHSEKVFPNARQANVQRYQKIIKMRMEHNQGKFTNLVDVVRRERNQFSIFHGSRYRLWVAILFLTELDDVDRFKLSRKWLWFYALVGPFRRVVRSFFRYLGHLFGQKSNAN